MRTHIPYLDGWRGLAIACLLLGHFFPVNGINFGTIGVALFFVLSGLLMAKILFVERTRFARFYRRRISRVFPSVVAYLLVISLAFVIFGKRVALDELLPALTFTNNYFIPENNTMPFGHIWSLSVEEHSYVILSIAAYWCRINGQRRELFVLGLVLAVTVFSIALYSLASYDQSTNFHLRTEVASFGIFASAFVFLAISSCTIRISKFWVAPAALVIGVLLHWWSVPVGIRVIVGWGALALAVNALPGASRIFLSIFELSWLRRLGTYSFSLYLWQQPYYQLVHHAGMSPWLGLILAMLTGILAYYFVEKPTRSYLNKRWSTPSAQQIDREVFAEPKT